MNIKNILSLVLILSSCSLFGAGRDPEKLTERELLQREYFKKLCVNGSLGEFVKYVQSVTQIYDQRDVSGCTLFMVIFRYGNETLLQYYTNIGFTLSDEDKKILEAMDPNENPKIKVNLAWYDSHMNKPLSNMPFRSLHEVSPLLSAIISGEQGRIKVAVDKGYLLSSDEHQNLSEHPQSKELSNGLCYYNSLKSISNK